MAKGKKTAAMLGLLGAGASALANKAVKVDPVTGIYPDNPDNPEIAKEAMRKYGFEGSQKYFANPNRTPTEFERMRARKKVFDTEPSLRGTLRTEDYQPILSGTGLPIRSGMKKGGKVSASRRADGIAKKGKTKGRML